MPSAKKSRQKNISELPAPDPEETLEIVTNEFHEPDEPKPIAQETHRVVRTWKKKVPVESNGNVDVIEIEAEPAAPPRPLDPIEELLKEIGVSPQQWSMTVHRLPNYERDGNCSPTAKKMLCGTLPFDANYAETIQAKFARPNKPNDFLVAVRCGSRIHSYLPVVQVEYVAPEVATDDPAQANHVVSAAVEPRDPFAELEKALRMVKRMNDALGVNQTLAPPAPPPEPPKLTTEVALLHLASEDPEQLAKMRDRIFGRDEAVANGEESLWTPIVKELLPTIPTIAQAALMYFTNQASAAPPVAPGQIASPQTPPQPPPPVEQPQPKTEYVLQQLINLCAQNKDVKEVVIFLWQLETIAPEVSDFLNVFVTTPPHQVLEFWRTLYPQATPITQADHAENWVRLLQEEMRDKETSEAA